MAATILIALTWLVVVASLCPALAKPVPAPDLTKCQPALKPDNKTTLNCCLPVGSNKIVDFKPPSYSTVRVRPAAHLVDSDYIAKYTRAIELMKSLGPDHRWNHMQQANIHCAYCNGAYNMTGYPVNIQIHGSWLFLPFHRLYLYFYERIIGNLIGDNTFAIPFWNWDAPAGMTLPEMYVNSSSPLYDPMRDPYHQPPNITDLNFDKKDAPPSVNLTARNLQTMYRQMVCSPTATLFMGCKYSAGTPPSPGGGALEMTPHNTVHVWTGDRRQKNWENMGTFYSAARDPVFYAHHANIDRMWDVWTTLPGKNRKNFNDADWLDSSFIFWDENLQLVRAKVRDCLDTKKLGYVYQNMPTPWRTYKSIQPTGQIEKPAPTKGVKLPVTLKSAVSVEVERPKVLRSREEKQEEEEVLVVDQITLDKTAFVKFDVFINAGADEVSITPESIHFAGTFLHLPMRMEATVTTARPKLITTRLLLGLTELLNEINADGDSSIVVTLVPRKEGGKVTVGDVRIELSS